MSLRGRSLSQRQFLGTIAAAIAAFGGRTVLATALALRQRLRHGRMPFTRPPLESARFNPTYLENLPR